MQQASASIGAQEAGNQAKAAQGAMAVQSAQIAGAGDARQAEAAKTETLLGMSQQRKGAADAARAAATESITSGIGDTIGGALKVGELGGVGGIMDMAKGFMGGTGAPSTD